MPIALIDRANPPEWHEGIRYRVPSATNPHETYLVDLTDYRGNGSCQCKDFDCRLRPFLSRLVEPAEAGRQMPEIRRGKDEADWLRCTHIIAARRKFTDEVLQRIAQKERTEARGERWDP